MGDRKGQQMVRISVGAYYKNGDLDVKIDEKLYKYVDFSPFWVKKLQNMAEKGNFKAIFGILSKHSKVERKHA